MSNLLTNLLPPERIAKMSREYLYRVITVAALAATLIVIANGALLLPSYLYIRGQAALANERLSALSAERAASGYDDLSSRIEALSNSVDELTSLAAVHTGSEAIRALLALPRTGIALSSFTYEPGEGGDGKMVLSGTAATRESLRAFDASLSELAFVKSSDLPLSAYAKESDIPFTITLALHYP
jgi:hypothetical protein